tara:strand:+ start:1254 stop:1478 length:225 start_codon:yes stop_codon:yes gene_type:complete
MVGAAVIVNEVEDYCRENAGKNLSVKKISKLLKIKVRRGVYLANLSDKLTKVDPQEVGSGKVKLNVFRYTGEVA